MLFNNVSQFAVLLLLLLVGWLFGFASHPGGKRWKRAYQDEAVARAQDRDELDTQLRDVDGRIAALTQEKTALEARNAELTAELERARAARPVAAPVYAPPPAPPVVEAAPVYAPPPPPPMPQYDPHVQPHPVAAAAAAPAFAPARPVEDAQWQPAPEQPMQSQAQVQLAAVPAPEAEPLPIKRGWFDWSRGDDLTRLRGVDEELGARLKAEKVESFAELAGLNDQEEIALERRLDLPAGYIMKEQLREQARMLADGDNDGHTARFG